MFKEYNDYQNSLRLTLVPCKPRHEKKFNIKCPNPKEYDEFHKFNHELAFIFGLVMMLNLKILTNPLRKLGLKKLKLFH